MKPRDILKIETGSRPLMPTPGLATVINFKISKEDGKVDVHEIGIVPDELLAKGKIEIPGTGTIDFSENPRACATVFRDTRTLVFNRDILYKAVDLFTYSRSNDFQSAIKNFLVTWHVDNDLGDAQEPNGIISVWENKNGGNDSGDDGPIKEKDLSKALKRAAENKKQQDQEQSGFTM